MKIILNKNKTKALLLGFSGEDSEVIKFLYDTHIVFGLYYVWIKTEENKAEDFIKVLQDKYRELTSVGILNRVEGYVPKYQKTKNSQTPLFDDL